MLIFRIVSLLFNDEREFRLLIIGVSLMSGSEAFHVNIAQSTNTQCGVWEVVRVFYLPTTGTKSLNSVLTVMIWMLRLKVFVPICMICGHCTISTRSQIIIFHFFVFILKLVISSVLWVRYLCLEFSLSSMSCSLSCKSSPWYECIAHLRCLSVKNQAHIYFN